jgi:protein-arginine kinase activator protein McsA
MESDGTRFCTHCQMRNRAIEHGEWRVRNNGKHRRWVCGNCVLRVRAKAQQRNVESLAGWPAGRIAQQGLAAMDRGKMGDDPS